MKQIKTFFLFFSLLISVGYAQQITSPDKKIKVVLEQKLAQNKVTNGEVQLYFKVLYKKGASYVEVLASSPLGIIRADQQFVSNLEFISESKSVAVLRKRSVIETINDKLKNMRQVEHSRHRLLVIL